uniref:CUB domain-containing protein n=1 Tax=Romanomermis culicivorax TaxID=13658 RepID=A0A915JR90_ROMCU
APKNYQIHAEFSQSIEKLEKLSTATIDSDYCYKNGSSYIEIRNGPYAFSPLLLRACPRNKIPDLVADSGAMWLYVKSKNRADNRWFKGHNYFSNGEGSPNVGNRCFFKIHQSLVDGKIDFQSVGNNFRDKYGQFFECVYEIGPGGPDKRTRIVFENLQLAFSKECSLNYVEIYERNTLIKNLKIRICDSNQRTMMETSTKFFLRFKISKPSMRRTNITLVYTFLKDDIKCSTKERKNFKCSDGSCIPKKLQCNGKWNCLSGEDEKDCDSKAPPELETASISKFAFIFIILMSAILTSVVLATIITNCPRNVFLFRRSERFSSPHFHGHYHVGRKISEQLLMMNRSSTVDQSTITSHDVDDPLLIYGASLDASVEKRESETVWNKLWMDDDFNPDVQIHTTDDRQRSDTNLDAISSGSEGLNSLFLDENRDVSMEKLSQEELNRVDSSAESELTHCRNGNPLDRLPGPKGVPILGYLPFMDRKIHLTLTELWRKYGDVYKIRVGSRTIVILNGNDTIRKAFVEKSIDFSGRPDFYTYEVASKGSLIGLVDYSERCRTTKKILLKSFGNFLSANKSELQSVAHKSVEQLLNVVKGANNQPFDPNPHMYPIICMIMGYICWGEFFDVDDEAVKEILGME